MRPFLTITLIGLCVALGCSFQPETPAFDVYNFKAPDSLGTTLTVTIFDEEAGTGITLLAFEDETRGSAKKVTYFTNGLVISEPLVTKAPGVYQSKNGKSEYIINKMCEYNNNGEYVTSNYHDVSCSISLNWTSDNTGVTGKK